MLLLYPHKNTNRIIKEIFIIKKTIFFKKTKLEPQEKTFRSFDKSQIVQSNTILYAYSDHKSYPLFENIRKINTYIILER